MHTKYTLNKGGLGVNKSLPLMMHVDMNSFFASCEQQENPLLRKKPVGVVPSIHQSSTIVAASVEAKKFGIKTGTKVRDALEMCPNIIFKEADPAKYRYINKKFMEVFSEICPNVTGKSIDEAVLNFSRDIRFLQGGYLAKDTPLEESRVKHKDKMSELAEDIRKALRDKVGDYLKCSIGVGTNYFLAKVASNVNKPNGFFYVDYTNIETFYDMLKLQDLHGVASKNEARLNKRGIFTPLEFYKTNLQTLQFEFDTFGTYWYLRLRGHEIDDYITKRKTIGHSYHLPKFTNCDVEIKAIALKLTEKACSRLRKHKLKARCFSFFILYSDGTSWNKSHRIVNYLDSTSEIYKELIKLFNQRQYPNKKVRILGISTSYFAKKDYEQKDLFSFVDNKNNFYKALDTINQTFGDFTLMPATLLQYKETAPDRISFGNKE